MSGAETGAAVSAWRGIESAPRDGTQMLGYWPGGHQHTGYILRGRWFDAMEEERGDKWSMPTHWMPLPPPPSSHDGEDPE